MAKTLNTRISLRYDTYANWKEKNPTLLAGEIAVVVIPADTNQVPQEPAVLFKVGDGETDFNTLPYACGLAADVYDWAKAAVKPEYSAGEIVGLSDYINAEIEDSNTTYTLEQDAADAHVLILKKKEIGDAEWTEVTRITTADTKYDDAISTNAGNIATNAGDIAALKELVGTTAVATQISSAIEALKLAESYDAKGAADAALEAAKAYADGKDTAIAEAKAAADAAQGAADAAQGAADAAKGAADAAQGAADAAQDDVDALALKVGDVAEGKTVSGLIGENAAAIAKNAEDIAANAASIETLTGDADTEGSVKHTVAAAIAGIMENPDETMNSIQELVTWTEDHAADALELSNQVSTNKSNIEANDTAIKANAAAIEANGTAIKANTDAIAVLNGSEAGSVAKTVSDAIEGALKLEGGAEKYALASDLSVTNGNVSKNAEDIAALDGSLAAIAKSGNVNALVQDEGDYMIFNCGSAADSF